MHFPLYCSRPLKKKEPGASLRPTPMNKFSNTRNKELFSVSLFKVIEESNKSFSHQ